MSVSVRRRVAFDISNVGASISALDRGLDSATFNALAQARLDFPNRRQQVAMTNLAGSSNTIDAFSFSVR